MDHSTEVNLQNEVNRLASQLELVKQSERSALRARAVYLSRIQAENREAILRFRNDSNSDSE